MEVRMIGAQKVGTQLGASKAYAFKVIRKSDKELKTSGKLVVEGKVNAVFSSNAASATRCLPQRTVIMMSVAKGEKRSTYTMQCQCKNWTGERRKNMKQGLASKRETQQWKHDFLAIASGEPTMSFGEFCKTYKADIKPRPKLNT